MKPYREYPPPPLLASFVDAFWCYLPGRDMADRRRYTQVRILPDGCMDLIARLHAPAGEPLTVVDLTLCGPTDRFAVVPLSPTDGFAGVRFKPGMGGDLLEAHPPELFGLRVNASEYSPGLAGLARRLEGPMTPRQILEAMQEFLSGPASTRSGDGASMRAGCALELLRTGDVTIRIGEVARQIGVSERTLHRDLLARTGLSPKTLARILRFQRVLNQLRFPEPLDLCGLAIDQGYADQSHLTREFRSLSGMTPMAIRTDKSGFEFNT